MTRNANWPHSLTAGGCPFPCTPDLPADDVRLGFYLDTLAEILDAQGRAADAEPLLRRAVDLCAKLPAESPARAEVASRYASLQRRTGMTEPAGAAAVRR